ncbi:transmembrane and immunoglobulin domain-containing protein 2 [Sorex fumeus]|uniref:transmembrane and immunoglobulin domain-containing protein 2 n=1 Tax=Sorex fumeus TaxID=62283 RepID=UPI0024AE1BC2|nr:transmembrane and immunoglobulin domain-containing protein 2 [Sorex fumeus]
MDSSYSALHSATGLSVYQEPAVQKAAPGSSVTFTCQVDDAQNVEKLWVIWNKDEVLLCQARVNYRSFSQGTCGPRGRFSWRPPGVFSLQLSPMSRNDSGHYTCCFTLEIPSLEEVSGNGTRLQVEETDSKRTDARETDSFPGLYSVLLVVGMVTVTLVILGTAACIWRRCFCRHRHSGNPPENPLYSNVPYRPRHTPKKTADWPVEGKVLEGHQEDQKDQGVYATTLPKSPRPQQRLIPKTCLSPNPKIKHPVSVAGATSGQWGPRRLLEADRRMVSGPARTPPPSGRRKM